MDTASSIDKKEQQELKTEADSASIPKNWGMRLFRSTIGPYISVLSTPYRWLWLSAMSSEFGNWFSNIANITTLTQISHGNTSGTAVSLMFVTSFAPPLLLNPIAGVIADAFDKRVVMLLSDIFRCIIVLTFLIVQIDIERLYWLLYVLNAAMFSCNAFFEPAREGLVPFLVSPDQLIATNSMDSITWSSVTFLGASVGGFAASFFGPVWNYIIDAITFALSSLCVVVLLRHNLSSPNVPGHSIADENHSNSNVQPSSKSQARYATLQNVEDDPIINDVELATCEVWNTDAAVDDREFSEKTPPKSSIITVIRSEDSMSEISQPNVDSSASSAAHTPCASGQDENSSALIQPEESPRSHRRCAPLAFICTHATSYVNGIRFAVHHPYAASFAFIKGSGSIISGVVDILVVKVAESTFKIGGNAAAVLGISNAIIGISAGISPVLEERIFPHSPRVLRLLVIENFVLMVIGMLLLGASISVVRNADESNSAVHNAMFVLFELGYLVIGAGLGCLWVKSTTSLQQLTTETYLGRMISLDLSVWVLGKVISVLLGGLLLDRLHLTIDVLCFIGAAGAFTVLVCWMLWAWKFSHVRVHTRAVE